MKRSIVDKDKKHNKKQKSEKCKIIDSIDIKCSILSIATSCGKFLIGIEGYSIFRYNLKTKQKFRIAGSVDHSGYRDGTRDESRFYSPTSLTLSKYGKTLFVADFYNRVIRAICVVTGITTTFTGQFKRKQHTDGPKEDACFGNLRYLKLSPDGNTLYVADFTRIRTICIATGQVDTFYITYVHDGEISKILFSPDGKYMYVCYWQLILKINLESRKYINLVSTDKKCYKLEISKCGQLLFVSYRNRKLVKIINIGKKSIIGSIKTPISRCKMLISANDQQLYISYFGSNKKQVYDISKYCTNFKTFLQIQLSQHSFLSQAVVKRFSI